MRLSNRLVLRYKQYSLIQGNYIDKHGAIDMKSYSAQTIIWLLDVVGAKLIIFLLYAIRSKSWNYIGQIVLSPLENFPVMKLIVVVIIVPIFANMYMFFIFDSLLKRKRHNNELDPQLVALVKQGNFDHDDSPEVAPKEPETTA